MGNYPPSTLIMSSNTGNSTRSLRADHALNSVTDVAPPLHLSTTFRYSDNPEELVPAVDLTVRDSVDGIAGSDLLGS